MKKIKRLIPILLVLLLALSMAPFASADDNPALVTGGEKGSITIHKFDSTGTDTGLGTAGNGTPITDTTEFGNPLNGIVFNITLLPTATISTTLEQAVALADGKPATASGTTGSGLNADGVYLFDDLVQGIYLVEEVTNSAVSGTVEKFLVSIPMTDPVNNSSWIYDIHVYPKNTVEGLTLEKEIKTAEGNTSEIAADIGEPVNWAIIASIPVDISSIKLNGTAPTGFFFIDDTLDDHLDYVGTTVTLIDSSGDVTHTFTSGTDFTLTEPVEGAAGGYIKVDFNNAAGIEKLTEALEKGWKIEIIIETTINKTAVEDLETGISNGAALYYENKGGDPSEPGSPEVEIAPDDPTAPVVNLTGIALYKFWKDGATEKPLDHAFFTIYVSEAAARAGTAMQKSSSDWTEETGVCLVDRVAMEGYIYFSQDDLMAALEYDPSVAADIEEFEEEYTEFFLVETTAPEGFELLNEAFEVEWGTTKLVENKKLSSGFTLPITGGSGTALFTATGILLIGGAVTLLLISKRKKKTK